MFYFSDHSESLEHFQPLMGSNFDKKKVFWFISSKNEFGLS